MNEATNVYNYVDPRLRELGVEVDATVWSSPEGGQESRPTCDDRDVRAARYRAERV